MFKADSDSTNGLCFLANGASPTPTPITTWWGVANALYGGLWAPWPWHDRHWEDQPFEGKGVEFSLEIGPWKKIVPTMFDHDVRFYPFEVPCKCLKLQIWVWCKIRGIVYNSLYSDMIHQKCNRHGDYPVPKAAEHTWLFDLIFTHKPSDVYIIRNDFMNLQVLRSGGQEVISLFVKKVPHSMDFGFLAAKPASLRTDFAHEVNPHYTFAEQRLDHIFVLDVS